MSTFNLKYKIDSKYIPVNSKRRSGQVIARNDVRFIVAHDTGNKNSTAMNNVDYYIRTCNGDSSVANWGPASAHIFVDDKAIIECIPVTTGPTEKAWHVRKNVLTDNQLFGYNANDAAIGVELCYGTKIISDEAYRKYIWTIAYLCDYFKLDPERSITGHFILDPERKTDPVSGLAFSRRTYEGLLLDIKNEYIACLGITPTNPYNETDCNIPLYLITTGKLNVRSGEPNMRSPIVTTLPVSQELKGIAIIDNGQSINGNSTWYKLDDGNYVWSGGIKII